MGNIRDPLSFVSPLTGGTPNVRDPLSFVEPLTGGQPNLRAALAVAEPLTGGNPKVRANYVLAEPLTGGQPAVRVALAFIEALIPVPEELPVATLVFPTLTRNLKWDRQKSPSFNNARRETTSGKRSVTAFMQYPRWNFELAYDVLPAQSLGLANLVDLEAISNLFQASQGGVQTFLYRDSDDWHVVGGSIATADGVTLQWPFFAAIQGGILQPVGQIDLSTLATFASSAVNTGTNAINVPNHGLTTGQEPPVFVANTGGALPTGLSANTPYWVIAVDANHIQLATTLPRALAADPISLSAAGSGSNTITKGWVAYETGPETDSVPATGPYTVTVTNHATFAADGGVTISGTPLIKVASSPTTGQYSVDPTSGIYTFSSAQASASAAITYTWQATNASLTLPNQLVFGSAPASGNVINADFDYWFQCRFDDDKLELNQFMSKLWDLQKLAFSSEV